MKKALIVDDEKDIGLMVAKFLESEGLKVDYVGLIERARSLINLKNYQMFFLDLKLPDGTGFDLISDIRRNNKDPKVVIISAYDGEKETLRARELGIDAYIKKPFTRTEVLEVVRDLS